MHTLRLATLAVLALATASHAFAKPRVYAEGVRAIETQGCPAGSYNVVTSPDGGALSVLFDDFVVSGTDANGGFARMTCAMEIPLHLPEGYSLGVYQVDYRGFAHLGERQRGELRVDYGTERGNRGRRFHREVKGSFDGDFAFNENLRGGILKRVGCGDAAVLNFAATLTLVSKRGARKGTMALDSVDGAPAGGLVFGLDLRKCRD